MRCQARLGTFNSGEGKLAIEKPQIRRGGLSAAWGRSFLESGCWAGEAREKKRQMRKRPPESIQGVNQKRARIARGGGKRAILEEKSVFIIEFHC